MGYYPIFIKLNGLVALVVGGGRVAERKVETLIEYGASVSIVSRELTDKLKALVHSGDILRIGEEFEDHHLDGVALVFAATDDSQLNHKVSEEAIKRGLLVNAVDQPADCTFIVPSIVKRKDLAIAISTSGKSPALAKAIRRRLESQFGKEYETFLDLMGCLRKEVLSAGFSQEENSRIFHELVESDILKSLAEDDWQGVVAALSRILPGVVDFKECHNYIGAGMKRKPANDFQDLIVWQKAHQFVLSIYRLTDKFPKSELYGLTSQFRRSAVSVPANIAEGFKKRSKLDKAKYMNIAQGSSEECRYYLMLSKDLGYGDTSELMSDLEEVSKLLEAYTSSIPDSGS